MSLDADLVNAPIWRSMLFVPAHVEKFVVRAHERGADACVLDLEDSVPEAQKTMARAGVRAAARQIAARGTSVLVRINVEWELAECDLDASLAAEVSAVVLPKVNDAASVRRAAAKLDALEKGLGLQAGKTRLIAMIEDVRALPALDEIAASSPRLLGMILGSEDFSASAGMRPTPEALLLPNQLVLFACRRAGILPFGFVGSIAEFDDLAMLRRQIVMSRQLGFVGAFCIHPAQAAVMNEEFSPSADEVRHAHGVIAAYEAARGAGRGAAVFEGKMIDPPVVNRAHELLRRAPKTTIPP